MNENIISLHLDDKELLLPIYCRGGVPTVRSLKYSRRVSELGALKALNSVLNILRRRFFSYVKNRKVRLGLIATLRRKKLAPSCCHHSDRNDLYSNKDTGIPLGYSVSVSVSRAIDSADVLADLLYRL